MFVARNTDSWLLGLLPDFGRGDTLEVVDTSACWNMITFSSPKSEICDVAHVDASQISAGDSHKLNSLVFAAVSLARATSQSSTDLSPSAPAGLNFFPTKILELIWTSKLLQDEDLPLDRDVILAQAPTLP